MFATLDSEIVFKVGMIVNMAAVCIYVILESGLAFCTNIEYVKNPENPRVPSTWLNLLRFFMYILGGCHLLYCLVYAWDSKNSDIFLTSIIFVTMGYIGSLLFHSIYFLAKERTRTVIQPLLLVGILFANIFNILLPIVDDKNSFNFYCHKYNSTTQNSNITFHIASSASQKVYPILIPGILGFSLMIFQDELSGLSERNNRFGVDSESHNISKWSLIKRMSLLFFFLMSFGLFCFALTAKLTIYLDSDFEIFIILQIILKILISIALIVVIIIFVKRQIVICSRVNDNSLSEWEIIYIICCMFSVGYQILLCIYVSKNSLRNVDIVTFFANNGIDIAVSIPQTVLIILAYSTNNKNQCENESSLCYLFSFVGFINMGFWLSDGIGAEWLTVLCCENSDFHLIGQKLLFFFLHFKIFFHFQTFLMCINFLWRPITREGEYQPLPRNNAELGNRVF